MPVLGQGSGIAAVLTRDLGRTYKARDRGTADVVALEGLSIEIAQGEVYGLLGPNGAGKTTLVKMLSTVLLPTHGSAEVLGHDVVKDTNAVRPLIGIVFGGDRGLYQRLSARQNLEYWAALYNVPAQVAARRVPELLERVGLADRAHQRAETFSRGMKQRLHLARGLVGDARVLFLDEPTMGMDPLAAREFRRLVGELRAEGRTILLTTHDMAEAESVCDRVALIDRGRLLAVETPRALSRLIAQHERIDFADAPDSVVQQLKTLPGVAAVTSREGATGYRVELDDANATRAVLECLIASGVTAIQTSRPSLEEVYVGIVGDRGLQV